MTERPTVVTFREIRTLDLRRRFHASSIAVSGVLHRPIDGLSALGINPLRYQLAYKNT